MITTSSTQQRIIKAMESGATLVFHCAWYGPWGDGFSVITKVTLERNGKSLTLSTGYREDERYWDIEREYSPLRCGEYSRPESGEDVADRVIKCPEIRDEYAGYRSDYSKRWREVYVHVNQPVPNWVSEQWDDVYQS